MKILLFTILLFIGSSGISVYSNEIEKSEYRYCRALFEFTYLVIENKKAGVPKELVSEVVKGMGAESIIAQNIIDSVFENEKIDETFPFKVYINCMNGDYNINNFQKVKTLTPVVRCNIYN